MEDKLTPTLHEILEMPKNAAKIQESSRFTDSVLNGENHDHKKFGRVISCHLLIEHLAEQFVSESIGRDTLEVLSLNTSKLFDLAATLPTSINLFKHFSSQIKEVNQLRNYYAHKILKTNNKKPPVRMTKNFAIQALKDKKLKNISDEIAVEIFTKIFSEYLARYEIICYEIKKREERYNLDLRKILDDLLAEQ